MIVSLINFVVVAQFYINYEECKSNITNGYEKMWISFILTMRNVNCNTNFQHY